MSKLSAATAAAADRQTQTKGWRIICAVSCHAPRECAHGWVGRRREEGVARMLDRSRISIAPLKTARPMAFACRKTHASLRLVLRPLSAPVLSLGARRPYPTLPARRPAVTPPRPSAVVPHQPLVTKWLNLCPQDAGSSIPRLCRRPEEMCSYP